MTLLGAKPDPEILELVDGWMEGDVTVYVFDWPSVGKFTLKVEGEGEPSRRLRLYSADVVIAQDGEAEEWLSRQYGEEPP